MVSTHEYQMHSLTMQKSEGGAAVVSELRLSKINDEEILAHFGKRQQFKVRCLQHCVASIAN